MAKKKDYGVKEVLMHGVPYMVGFINGKMYGNPVKMLMTDEEYNKHVEELRAKGYNVKR